MSEAPKENQCRFTAEDMGCEDSSDDKWMERLWIGFSTIALTAMVGIAIAGFFHSYRHG